MKVGSSSIEIKTELKPSFCKELGFVGFVLICYVLFRIAWG